MQQRSFFNPARRLTDARIGGRKRSNANPSSLGLRALVTVVLYYNTAMRTCVLRNRTYLQRTCTRQKQYTLGVERVPGTPRIHSFDVITQKPFPVSVHSACAFETIPAPSLTTIGTYGLISTCVNIEINYYSVFVWPRAVVFTRDVRTFVVSPPPPKSSRPKNIFFFQILLPDLYLTGLRSLGPSCKHDDANSFATVLSITTFD